MEWNIFCFHYFYEIKIFIEYFLTFLFYCNLNFSKRKWFSLNLSNNICQKVFPTDSHSKSWQVIMEIKNKMACFMFRRCWMQSYQNSRSDYQERELPQNHSGWLGTWGSRLCQIKTWPKTQIKKIQYIFYLILTLNIYFPENEKI